MNKINKDKLESDILENIIQLQKYLTRTAIDSLEPEYQLIRKQLRLLHNMLVFINLTKPIVLDKASLGYAGDQNAPIPIYKEDKPLYKDSVGGEDAICSPS